MNDNIFKIHKLETLVEVTGLVNVAYYKLHKGYIWSGEAHDFWEMVYVDKGAVEIQALCQEEEEDRWQRVRGSAPFSLEVDVPGCREDSVLQLRAEVLRCDALIRNPRKLQLQAQVGVFASFFFLPKLNSAIMIPPK